MEAQLTPDLVVMAIQGGLLDESLDSIKETVRLRKEVISVQTANSLTSGDRFLLKDISPKKYDGVEVEFTGEREGIWLKVVLVHDADVQRLFNCSPDYVSHFRKLKVRKSHIGTLMSTRQSRAQDAFNASQGV